MCVCVCEDDEGVCEAEENCENAVVVVVVVVALCMTVCRSMR